MHERHIGVPKIYRIVAGLIFLTGAVIAAVESTTRLQESNIELNIGQSLNWSPDGKRFAYLQPNSYYIHRGEVSWDTLVVINSDGSKRNLLEDVMGHLHNPQWSKDGKNILLSSSIRIDEEGGAFDDGSPDNYSQIAVVDVETGKATQILAPEFDSNPQWSPDGKKIIFDSKNNGATETLIMDQDGSNRTLLFH